MVPGFQKELRDIFDQFDEDDVDLIEKFMLRLTLLRTLKLKTTTRYFGNLQARTMPGYYYLIIKIKKWKVKKTTPAYTYRHPFFM